MPKWNLTPSRQYLLTEVASFTFPKPGSPDSGTVQRWICTMIGTQLILGGAILLIGLLTLAHLSTCQQQKSARTSAVLNSPSIRIQPLHPPPSFPTPSSAPASLVSMANYDPKSAESRPYESFMQDGSGMVSPRRKQSGTSSYSKRGHYSADKSYSAPLYGRIYDSTTKKYEPSPSKVSYEIKLYMPKHDASPEYPVKPYAPPPGYMHYPYEDIPDYAYEERSLYSSPKYEQQKMPYMKPYYSPDGKTVYENRQPSAGYLEAVYGSQYPEKRPVYVYQPPAVDYEPMYRVPTPEPVYKQATETYRPVYKEVYEPSYKAEAPSYRPAPTPTPYELTYRLPPVSYKPSEPTTYESAPKQIYREIDATYDPPPPQSTYQSYYKTKVKPEVYSHQSSAYEPPYDQQQMKATYERAKMSDVYAEPPPTKYAVMSGMDRDPTGYLQQEERPVYYAPVQQQSPPVYYAVAYQPKPPEAPSYAPQYVQASPPTYPSYGYGAYANY